MRLWEQETKLIMCDWGKDREIVIEQHITVDSCIADEIVELNRQGIRTEECCCGHHKAASQALIRASSVPRARELGYDPTYYDNDNGLFEIKLKGGKISKTNVPVQSFRRRCPVEIKQWTNLSDRGELINDLVLNADPTENGTDTWIITVSGNAFHKLRSEVLAQDQARVR